ncbi:hypothetical protein AKJ40_03160 [candidate division MSBL1 archaeon SCGC-AAA259M10]|uniref:Uncharacterized protein n=2 Tax=candidate division MSBL1 TaxID=215777 RepID=A0A133V5T1_9EURY|nr:hypothetical protein AKJ40_03160 [candidate division MSBL1 archaeon SCGC-AAA259M10]KXB01801.1 hypothetical protein AKJ41_00025 [candidate division MSBL1 archaeon SCGC-AAA259O05]
MKTSTTGGSHVEIWDPSMRMKRKGWKLENTRDSLHEPGGKTVGGALTLKTKDPDPTEVQTQLHFSRPREIGLYIRPSLPKRHIY